MSAGRPAADTVQCDGCGRRISKSTMQGLGCPWCGVQEGDE